MEAAGALPAFGEGIDLAGHNSTHLLVGLWSGHGETAVDPTVLIHRTAADLRARGDDGSTVGCPGPARPAHSWAGDESQRRRHHRRPSTARLRTQHAGRANHRTMTGLERVVHTRVIDPPYLVPMTK